MLKNGVIIVVIFAFLAAGCAGSPFGKEKEPTVKIKESEYNKLLDEKGELEWKVSEMVGKSEYDALLDEKAVLERKIAEMVARSEYDALLKEKAILERKVDEIVARSKYDALLKDKEKAALQDKLKASEEQIVLLQREKSGEKIILIFDGKIKYSVEVDAVMDYEELLVIGMISDPKFKEAQDMGGKEADISLIGLLKKLSPDDRRITKEEVQAYLKSKKK